MIGLVRVEISGYGIYPTRDADAPSKKGTIQLHHDHRSTRLGIHGIRISQWPKKYDTSNVSVLPENRLFEDLP